MALFDTVRAYFGLGGSLADRSGKQYGLPGSPIVEDTPRRGPDGALQLSTVWSCIERRANLVASLPLFVYEQQQGQKTLARGSRLYQLLHDSPNGRMTPFEFWRAMMMNYDLRGNAYARIDRDQAGEAVALWPMPADQVEMIVLPDSSTVYTYRMDVDVLVLAEENVLHLKNLGNGTSGLSKLEFMSATLDESTKAQASASKIFGSGGKPTGTLMIDRVLSKEQREAVKRNFAEMQTGNASRLFLLEASMKYQQLSISPEDQQLLETRHFGVEELCRWFDVPPVLAHHSNVTTWGSGIEQIMDGFYKLTVRPLLVSVEQSLRKRVMTPRQRATMTIEFSLDALLRGNAAARAELYAKQVQNGLKTRNEIRQLENDPPDPSPLANALTVQTNLVPIEKLGQMPATGGSNAPAQNTVAQ